MTVVSLKGLMHVAIQGLTENEIKVQLAEEENREAANGKPALHKVTPLSMLIELLEIEKVQ